MADLDSGCRVAARRKRFTAIELRYQKHELSQVDAPVTVVRPMRLRPTSLLGLFAPGLLHPATERLLAPVPPHLGLITCLALRYERLSFDIDLFDVELDHRHRPAVFHEP